MRLLIAVLALCACRAAEIRKAMAVLYENSSSKGEFTGLQMVGIVEFSQEGPSAKLLVNINLFSNSNIKDGLHGFHIHKLGR